MNLIAIVSKALGMQQLQNFTDFINAKCLLKIYCAPLCFKNNIYFASDSDVNSNSFRFH